MPFKDPHPEDDDHLLGVIDELIDLDPYGASKHVFLLQLIHVLIQIAVSEPPHGIPSDPNTEAIVDNAKAYVGTNFTQFPFRGYESIPSLVRSKDAFYHRLESNTRDLYLLLKVRHVLVQHYRLVTAKLDFARDQEETHADAAAQSARNSHPSSAPKQFPYWLFNNKRGRRSNKRDRAQKKGKGKKHNRKAKEVPKPVLTKCVEGCNTWGWGCEFEGCPNKNYGNWEEDAHTDNVRYQDGVRIGNGFIRAKASGSKASGSKASGSKKGKRF